MIDEKGRLFGKLNLLDLFLILLFIAVAIVAGLFLSGKDGGSETVPIHYVIEIQNKEEAYFDHVVVGEKVSDGITGAYLGTIYNFEKKPAQVISQANDKLVVANPEGRFDGYVTISADAAYAYPDYVLGGEPIKIGSEIAYRSETLAMHGYIVDVNIVLEERKGAAE
ncbi:MAG: DUF4330 domain-containing protein [Clostridia bacterium]|nr:DUF4330 domain-containing protein [Clostridia bacterium]